MSDAAFKVNVTQEANRIKANCKRLFADFDPSKCFSSFSFVVQKDRLTVFILKTEKAGTMPWTALKRLLEMQGINLNFEDS